MKPLLLCLLFSGLTISAFARDTIRPGEETGIPDRADAEKDIKGNGRKKEKTEKREVRQSQEKTDPVFYDSTTSPKEMEDKRNEDI